MTKETKALLTPEHLVTWPISSSVRLGGKWDAGMGMLPAEGEGQPDHML